MRLVKGIAAENACELQIICYRGPTVYSRDDCKEGHSKPASEKPEEKSAEDVQIPYYKGPTLLASKAATSQISQASSGSAQGHRPTSQALHETVAEFEQRQPTKNPASTSRKMRRKSKGIYREILLHAKARSYITDNRLKKERC